MSLDVHTLRRQFPALQMHPERISFDAAATTHKPAAVLDAITSFYTHSNANVHRSMDSSAQDATDAYEAARETVRAFVGAKKGDAIVFTRNATEAINLVARSYADAHLSAGHCIALSAAEHHANIVPWQQWAMRSGGSIRWMDIGADGMPLESSLERVLTESNVRIVALTAQSNVLGTRPPVRRMVELAHAAGAIVVLDAAQLAAHAPLAFDAWEADALVFSGHKTYGPMGIGVLVLSQKLAAATPPFLGGGSMVQSVTQDGFTATESPQAFEAGTPAVADAVGLASALDWLSALQWEDRIRHEAMLTSEAVAMLHEIPSVRILGEVATENRHGCISFTTDGVHPHDLTHVLGQRGFALRGGQHCAQPLHAALGVPASSRLSLALYHCAADIAALQPVLADTIRHLQR